MNVFEFLMVCLVTAVLALAISLLNSKVDELQAYCHAHCPIVATDGTSAVGVKVK